MLEAIREMLGRHDRNIVVTGDYYDEQMITMYKRLAKDLNCALKITIKNINIYTYNDKKPTDIILEHY